jgi:stearoyl-CoA desaturase (delta-9 desaturase)
VKLHPAIGFVMHLHLALFTGIVPREWVAVHRKHHNFSDKEGDPHSPYIYGLWKVFFGNYFYYHVETKDKAMVGKYTADYCEDWIDKIKIPFMQYKVLGGLAILMLMFGWLGGVLAWASHVVLYILLNSSINSICHMIGHRNYNNPGTNLQSIALFTGGEGLHNNHHKYPTSPRFSWKSGEFDPAWPVIRILEILGLAKVSRLPIEKAAAQ